MMPINLLRTGLRLLASSLLLSQLPLQAVDFHVATAQDLQNALTLAANNSADNNIYLTNGYYTGNFNYNSTSANNLMILAEPGVSNTQIAIDGGGLGRAMYLTSTGIGSFTVQGITFVRNCGNTSIGALGIAAGSGASIFMQNCQFLSPNNTTGMGLELDSGLNATITNCIAVGILNRLGGYGISVTGVTGTVNVENCIITTNTGYGVSISGASAANITGCLFTGTYNNGNYGSGLYCGRGVTANVSNNLFSGNTAYFQAGGAFLVGNATVVGNTFIGNLNIGGYNNSGQSGGGLLCQGVVTIISNSFFGNSAGIFEGGGSGSGGGASCWGPATIIGNTFSGNSTANGPGGAILCANSATITGNAISSNSCLSSGGGVYCNGGSTYIIASNVFQQNVSGTGGGVYVDGSTVTVQDNLVVNNSETSATSQGGGVWVDAAVNLFMINNTITGNQAAGGGGGAAFTVTGTAELLNVYNNIIWGNTANGNGGDVWLAGTGQKKIFDFNDADSMYGVWDIAQNNIDFSPKFFDPVNGDYHTQSTSPCANAGTSGAPSLPLTDLDGNARTNTAGLVDIGCYEFNTTAAHPADANGDFVISPAEFSAYASAWKNGQTWPSGPNPIPANYVTRAGYLMTNGGTYYNSGSARPVNWKLIGQ